MRKFHSYGPVNARSHFFAPRTDLVNQCLDSLIGSDNEDGHYFTLWAPRQTGKTWLMHEVQGRIQLMYPEQFIVGMMSMQGLSFTTDKPVIEFLKKVPKLFLDTFSLDIKPPKTYEEWTYLFHRTKGVFKKPLILFIDEFDGLPAVGSSLI